MMSLEYLIITFLLLLLSSVVFCHIRYRKKHNQSLLNTQLQSEITIEQPQNLDKQDENAINAARNRYLSGISHELRTPLNVIMGYAQLLEKKASPHDPNKEKYSLMRHNCQHLAHLIEGILEFSAIEAGRIKVQQEWVDLEELIKQIIVMFKSQALKKGLTFESNIDARLPNEVKTDHKRLQQILINLLSNAIKFTDEGSIGLDIKYRNQIATFTIKDTGCGIDENDLQRIFIPFERVERSHKKTSGTGLGLSITQMLAELLGGELKVKSTIGSGSEFIFKIMLAPQTAFNHSKNDANPQIEVSTNQNIIHNVLVVDDEASHRDLTVEILKDLPFKITVAADGLIAQSDLSKNFYHLAIIDVAMPNLNGWQLAQWINQNHPETKIIMLSGNPRDAEKNQKAHYNAYLTKPVNVSQLLSQISQILELGWHENIAEKPNESKYKKIVLKQSDHAALQNMVDIGHINGIQTYLDKLLNKKFIDKKQYEQMASPLKNMNLKLFKSMIDHEQS